MILIMFKKFITRKLENYVKKYFKNHPEVKLVVITGSVGKTTTKRAIGTVLAQRFRIGMNEGNHNTELSAPLSILGIEYPQKLHSIGAWLRVFRAASARVRHEATVDVIIQELGADSIGDIATFGRYLKPDIAVVTAVSPEHMEFFKTMDAVAEEELSISNYSKMTVINRDDIDGDYAKFINTPDFVTYGTTAAAEYRVEVNDYTLKEGYKGRIFGPEFPDSFEVQANVLGEHTLRAVVAAVAVGAKLGMLPNEIAAGVSQIQAAPGRMNLLDGIDNTLIIDDSYNSSPAAASAALQVLYSFTDMPQRIAVLGQMNELGETSKDEHEKLGLLCDGELLSWVVVVGAEAEKYLAPAARSRGCQVQVAKNAIEAGKFVRSITEPGAVILVKGSQGGIFLEETVKILCDMSEDIELVRQSPEWQATKDKLFSQY